MAQNSLFPAFARIFYTGLSGEHTMTVPLGGAQPGAINPAEWSVLRADGAYEDFATAISDYVTQLANLSVTTMNFVEAELYTMDSPTADPLYRRTVELGVAGGVASSPEMVASQTVFSFRSANGGVGKITLLDRTVDGLRRRVWRNNNPVSFNALRAYLLSDDNIVHARDGGLPIGTTYVTEKFNDALRRKVLDL